MDFVSLFLFFSFFCLINAEKRVLHPFVKVIENVIIVAESVFAILVL